MARLDPTGVSRILSYIKTWVTTALGGKANSSHSHTKSQITDFPTIPSSTSQLTNDSGYITSSGSCNYANSAGSAGSATTAETVSTSVAADSSKNLVYASMANTDQCRIMCGGADNNGYLEIATSDDGNEPIYVRQYNNGTFGSVVRTLTLLDGSGNTQFPGTVSAPTFTGNVTGNCSGTAGSVAWDNVSGKPSAFTPYFANGTWYAVGDDAAIGDHNVGGGLGVKALNSTTTRIDLCYKDNASNYKSITYDGTTLYMNGNCDYATSAGSCNYANSAGNSDTLDGYHEYSFLRNRGATDASGEGTLWAQIGIKEYLNALPDGLNDVYPYGETVSLAGTSCRFDIYCSHISSDGNGLYYRSGWNDDKKAWRCFIDSANIGSQSVNYANSAGSAGSVAWSNVTGKPTIPTNTNQLTNGAGYITSSGSCSSSTYSTYLNSLGAQTPKSGRDIFHPGVYTYTTYTDTNTPAYYGAVIGYGNGQGGSCEMFAEWVGEGQLWFRVLRDYQDSWTSWQKINTESNTVLNGYRIYVG